ARLVRLRPQRTALREDCERYFLDRASPQVGAQSPVLHDVAAAHVDTVVREAKAGCGEVRPQQRLASADQRHLARVCPKRPVGEHRVTQLSLTAGWLRSGLLRGER